MGSEVSDKVHFYRFFNGALIIIIILTLTQTCTVNTVNHSDKYTKLSPSSEGNPMLK